MESNHDHQPTSEISTVGDDQGASLVTNPRSYECNFCQRGFSNAQALGGHMNIHRKDKAKLKQQSSNQITHQPSSLDIHHHHRVPSSEGKSLQQGHVHVVHMKQLPLFEESPASSKSFFEESPASSKSQKPQPQIHGEIVTQRALSSGQGSSLELDLELRLGLEPLDSSAATTTKKFF